MKETINPRHTPVLVACIYCVSKAKMGGENYKGFPKLLASSLVSIVKVTFSDNCLNTTYLAR